MNLFEQNLKTNQPLAQRMRPKTLEAFKGHEGIIGKDTLLRNIIENDELISLIFWAPPGCGKTTLARIIANMTNSEFVGFSAVSGGVKQIREIVKAAEDRLLFHKKPTVLFVDEIHRFNKAQQDYFLPHVESGVITLIGATTENPSFEVNSALLSRCKVFKLSHLTTQNIADLIVNAIKDKDNGYGMQKIKISKNVIKFLSVLANGDARTALNTLEFTIKAAKRNKDGILIVNEDDVKQAVQRNYILYDKNGEEHYNIISALHKSMRGHDIDASLYWMARMLEGGQDPLYIARRLIRFASEDIGMANPQALVQATQGYQACHYIGVPECNVILAQVVVYLANSPKSNALYEAYNKIQKDVHETITDPVPLHLRNAPTDLMKGAGYGKGYKYNPNFKEDSVSMPINQEYLPKKIQGKKYFDIESLKKED